MTAANGSAGGQPGTVRNNTTKNSTTPTLAEQCGAEFGQCIDSISCTLLKATTPSSVTKEFSIGEGGNMVKKTTAQVFEGSMEVVTFSAAPEFVDMLVKLNTNQCLIYGTPPSSPITLITEAEWVKQGRPKNKLPRLKSTLHWPRHGGVMMLDYDMPKGGRPAMTKDELLSVTREACPNLRYHDIIWWPSTSSCIWHGNKEITGIGGQRIYLLVEDASDIPRAGKELNDRLWAQGRGHFEVSKSGSLLERGIFDSSVWQTNRIDFAAGAKCHDGLEQRRGAPKIIEGEYDGLMNTRESIPDLAPGELSAAKANKLAAKAAVATKADQVRGTWTAERMAKLLEANPGMNDVQAGDVVRRAAEHRELMGDWRLFVRDNGTDVEVTVLSVLDNPSHYHGMQTYDPLEPDYDGGRLVGKLYLFSARPRLHSMAHGGVTFGLSRQPARIELVRGKSTETADKLIAVLKEAPDIFDFGEELVIVSDGTLSPLNEFSLAYHAGRKTQFWRWHNIPNKGLVELLEDPPVKVCKSVLSLKQTRGLKQLKAVITAPTLRPDGSVLSEIGFDAASGLLFDAEHLPEPIPMRPSKMHAEQAIKTLWRPFEDFPFVDAVARAAYLAALLTAAVRPALKVSPGFGIDAPVQAAGKTLAAQCVAAIATGMEPAVWPHIAAGNDDEVRKRLFTALRFGARAILWDNVVGTFDSAAMAAMLTSASYSDRILGSSNSSTVPNRAMLLMTGNNLTLSGDMSRRVLVARMDPETDKPFARCFDLDPLAHCLAHRQDMVAAALTLVRFYLTKSEGRPRKSRMASFEQWDDCIAMTVLYVDQELGLNQFGDVMDQIALSQTVDPDAEALGELLAAWHELFGYEKKTAADVVKIDKEGAAIGRRYGGDSENRLINAFKDIAPHRGELTSKSVGRILRYRVGRIVGGLRFTSSGGGNVSTLWNVQPWSGDAKVV